MPKKVVGANTKGVHSNIITRSEIIRAQQNTVSNAAAAKFLDSIAKEVEERT